eukprot:3868656-Pyramimonas_sp.AAC.1
MAVGSTGGQSKMGVGPWYASSLPPPPKRPAAPLPGVSATVGLDGASTADADATADVGAASIPPMGPATY